MENPVEKVVGKTGKKVFVGLLVTVAIYFVAVWAQVIPPITQWSAGAGTPPADNPPAPKV